MSKQISEGLAISMAGQIAVGLTDGDEQEERVKFALWAIGLMLLTATNNDERVRDQLNMTNNAVITRREDGGWSLSLKGGDT
jgi:hypothetical protein